MAPASPPIVIAHLHRCLGGPRRDVEAWRSAIRCAAQRRTLERCWTSRNRRSPRRADCTRSVSAATYVFPSAAHTPFSAFSKNRIAVHKEAFPDKAAHPDFTLHDLRRTAKTLMARAGVRPDISERVLGHVIAGVEGIYDRHSYADEKRDALEKLAALIDLILHPPL